jgi:hypothetical protein
MGNVLLAVAIAAVVAWLVVRPGDCVIRKRRGDVTFRGRVTAAHRGQIETYLREHFPHVGRLRVDVWYRRGAQPPKVRIRGVPAGERQMIRNFLLSLL